MLGLILAYKLSQPLHCPENGSESVVLSSLLCLPPAFLAMILLLAFHFSVSSLNTISPVSHTVSPLSLTLSSLLFALPCPHPWHTLPQRT